MKKKPRIEITVARQKGGPGAEHAVHHGEHEGWVQFVKAKDGTALKLQWPRKAWAVLDGKQKVPQLVLYDSKRSMKPLRSQPLKGGQVKTPVMMLRGQELEQPPVIAKALRELRFPFTVSWPAGEVRHLQRSNPP